MNMHLFTIVALWWFLIEMNPSNVAFQTKVGKKKEK